MAEYAKTNGITNLFAEPSIDSMLITQIDLETSVAVVEHGSLWSKIIFNTYEGFCETQNLSFENCGDNNTDKTSKITISLTRETACVLYNALKFSLKL